ncbi:MAG: hypothetical protein IKZ82_08520 [Clostridia bacterium]|nr:hypothetical protein [Clostridia bacterium]
MIEFCKRQLQKVNETLGFLPRLMCEIKMTVQKRKKPMVCRIICDKLDCFYALEGLQGQKAVGSNPVALVVADFVSFATTFLFQKSHLSLTPPALLPAKVRARLACSVVNALTTARCRYHTFADFAGNIQ